MEALFRHSVQTISGWFPAVGSSLWVEKLPGRAPQRAAGAPGPAAGSRSADAWEQGTLLSLEQALPAEPVPPSAPVPPLGPVRQSPDARPLASQGRASASFPD